MAIFLNKDYAEFNQYLKSRKADGGHIVATNGCFDVLHPGHISIFEACRDFATELGDGCVIVLLNSDSGVRKLKGENRPYNDVWSRARVIDAITAVDCVVEFTGDDPTQMLWEIQPDVLVKGGDYEPEELLGGQHCGRIEIVPLMPGFSTTRISEKIKK